jgi:opacity protein-like surface antigen
MSAEGFVRYRKLLAFTVAALAAAAGPARADGFVTPYIGYNFGGDSANCQSLTNCEEKHLNFGASFMSAGSVLALEEEIGYAKDFFGSVPGSDNSVFTAMTNLAAGVFKGPVQPYFLVGVGLIRSHVSLDVVQGSGQTSNSFGWNVGGGLQGFFSRKVGIRGDLRHLKTFGDVSILNLGPVDLRPSQSLGFWRGSLGVAFRF